MFFSYIPKELLHIILEYDGRIKYRRSEYVNIIHKKDYRYFVIYPVINKKIDIIKKIIFTDKNRFYFDFCFNYLNMGLSYDFNWSFDNQYEISFYYCKNGWYSIRTYNY